MTRSGEESLRTDRLKVLTPRSCDLENIVIADPGKWLGAPTGNAVGGAPVIPQGFIGTHLRTAFSTAGCRERSDDPPPGSASGIAAAGLWGEAPGPTPVRQA